MTSGAGVLVLRRCHISYIAKIRKTKYKVLMTNVGFTKIVKFITTGAGVHVVGRGHTYHIVKIPDSNHLLGQPWHFVGSFVGPTSTNDVSPMSFCSSGQLNCQPLVRCWSNARTPTSPAYANVMPTILFQVSTYARHDLWAPSININSLDLTCKV